MFNPRFVALALFTVCGAFFRLIPHPYNFTPIVALALFGGAHFQDKKQAYAITFAAMFLSDLFLGFHELMWAVYGSFAVIVAFGFWLQKRRNPLWMAGASLTSSSFFFVTTNFAVWAFSSLYPKTLSGLVDCYIAAIPFFQNSLIGDLCYVALFFGGFELAERTLPILRRIPASFASS